MDLTLRDEPRFPDLMHYVLRVSLHLAITCVNVERNSRPAMVHATTYAWVHLALCKSQCFNPTLCWFFTQCCWKWDSDVNDKSVNSLTEMAMDWSVFLDAYVETRGRSNYLVVPTEFNYEVTISCLACGCKQLNCKTLSLTYHIFTSDRTVTSMKHNIPAAFSISMIPNTLYSNALRYESNGRVLELCSLNEAFKQRQD